MPSSKNKQKESKSKQSLNVSVKRYFSEKRTKINTIFKRATLFLKDIPGWIHSRPQAIRAWHKADKKKKKYRSFRLQKRIKPEPRYVPSTLQLLKQTGRLYRQNFWIFACTMFVHAVLYFLFVRGVSNFDFQQVQESIRLILGENSGASGTFALLGSVLGSQQQREGSGIYNLLIILFISLANIWIIRRIYAKAAFRVRDGFYQAFSSLVPFLLILIVMSLQALPFSITSYVYVIGRTNGLFISGVEDLSFFLIALLSGLLSLYWMTTSIIALYAVTLPNMYPVATLRLTKKIVRFRRFLVFRRILAFPIIVGLVSLVVLLICIRFAPQYSPLLVEAFPILLLPVLHGYYFNLYRSLI